MIFCLQVIIVAVIGTRKIKKYHDTINQLYADTENKEVRGIPMLLILFVATSVCSIIFNIIGRYCFINSLWLSIPSLSFTILLFLIGWYGMHQHFTMSDVIEQHPEEAIAANIFTSIDKNVLCTQLDQLMKEKKLFLEHDLRLEQVTRELGTNRTYLLQALKEGMDMTFKEYINRLRIAYAEKLMKDNPSLTKSDIATMSGYNTQSSFYRNYNSYKSTR
jgi:AraC-like DNA-binding protein